VTETTTLGSLVAQSRRRLADAGIDTAALDARLLVRHALSLPLATMIGHPDRPVDATSVHRVDRLVARRSRHEPLAYITGSREFWSLAFRVTDATLVPRPDSETVVEAAVAVLAARPGPARVLDLGTGSGCLLLSILRACADASGVGIDRSFAALAVARANAHHLGLVDRARFVCADWASGIAGVFDLVVCNPPYIDRQSWNTLTADVRAFEPPLALDGGADGLDAFRQIVPQLPALLAANGTVIFEIGAGQASPVSALLRAHGLQSIETRKDLSGRWRCVVAHA